MLPMKAKLAKKLMSLAFFLFSRKIFMIPIAKTITVTILKNTKRYEGIVSYMWYLSESPSFIFPSKVRIKFIRPNIETRIKVYLLNGTYKSNYASFVKVNVHPYAISNNKDVNTDSEIE